MEVKAYAKINLCLDVLKRKDNGYHEVDMVMTNVNIFDVLEINERNDSKILLSCDNQELAMDESNLIYKAITLLQRESSKDFGIEIKLKKNIPMQAGMAGGSADAAATLRAVNGLLKLEISESRLLELGAKLGADVPFCITGGTVLARGIGEKLVKLKDLPKLKLLIAKPKTGLSTKEVYESLDIEGLNKSGFIHPSTENMVLIIESEGDDNTKIKGIANSLGNILELPALRLLPEIEGIKRVMKDSNCLGCLMSGSGTSVFGIFENDEDIYRAADILKKNEGIDYINITHTIVSQED